jgi:signal transduction histidine kinase
MATTSTEIRRDGGNVKSPSAIFFWTASSSMLLALGWHFVATWGNDNSDLATLAAWTLASLAADLLVVRFRGGFTFSMSLAVTLAAAMALPSAQAAVVAFVGCLDPVELRGGSALSRALYNRCQVALATLAAALVFGNLRADVQVWPLVLPAALAALLADFTVNSGLASLAVWAKHGTPPAGFFHELFGATPVAGLGLYLSLGLFAPVLALAELHAGPWGLGACLIPLAIARSSMQRGEGLSAAEKGIARKDAALRETLGLVADERRDERRALAAELHDEVLPALFKVHLMGQVISRDLQRGMLLQLEDDVAELVAATESAQAASRKVVADLRDSPLGPGGVGAALDSLAAHLETLGGPPFAIVVGVLDASDRATLVAYQVAREAMTNAAKHAHASRVDVRVWIEDGLIRVQITDNGVGFDARAGGVEGHFGLPMMEERVNAIGGRLVVDSRLGAGTSVGASIPPDS